MSLESYLRSICVQQAITVTASVTITSVLLSSSTKEPFTDSMTLLGKREKFDFVPHWPQVAGSYIAIDWPITAELLYKAGYVCAGSVSLLFKQLLPCFPAWPLVCTYSVALLLLGWTICRHTHTHTRVPKALEPLLPLSTHHHLHKLKRSKHLHLQTVCWIDLIFITPVKRLRKKIVWKRAPTQLALFTRLNAGILVSPEAKCHNITLIPVDRLFLVVSQHLWQKCWHSWQFESVTGFIEPCLQFKLRAGLAFSAKCECGVILHTRGLFLFIYQHWGKCLHSLCYPLTHTAWVKVGHCVSDQC